MWVTLLTHSTRGILSGQPYVSEELRAFMEDAVERSRTLAAAAHDARYGSVKEKELVDRLREEMEEVCLLYTSPSPRDATLSRMPSSA